MKASRQEQCLTIKLNQKMKKNIFISAALACVAFSSCQQENLGGNGAELDGFRVHTEDMAKAVLDGVKVVFEDEDAIDIYADNAETPAVYSYNKANDLFVATGTEAEGKEYTAIFPSRATNASRSSIYISNRQVATVNSFPKNSMYMAGVSNSKEIALKHLTGLWEIDLLPQYDGQKLVRASLTVKGDRMINGNFEINWDDYSLTYVDGGTRSILLAEIGYVMKADEPVKLYFALPEGSYEGFTFQAVMTDNTTMEVVSPSTINIVKGQITKVKNNVNYRLFDSGTGTETDPYVIKGVTHWNNMVQKINSDPRNYASAYYKVAADIDFKNAEVTPIKTFKGVLDGGHYTVKNAKIDNNIDNNEEKVLPSFFYLLAGTVKNMNFDNITVTSSVPEATSGASTPVGVVVSGNNNNAFILENCHVTNSTVTSGAEGDKFAAYAGGLVGRCNNASTLIKNCSVSNTTVSGLTEHIGGLVGLFNAGTMQNVESSGNTVTAGTRNAGGVAGTVGAGTIQDVESSGNTVTSGADSAGGVAGRCELNAMLVNVISKNNICTATTISAGGVVGDCTSSDTSNNTKIMNVLSVDNTVKSLTHANILFLGGAIGGHNSPKTYKAKLTNCLVLSGKADYVFNSTESSYVAGCVGIIVGLYSISWENCIYNQARRNTFDITFTDYVSNNLSTATNYNSKWSYRYGAGAKYNTIVRESNAGTDKIDNVSCSYYTSGKLTDGTALDQLNQWVNNNKDTYPALKNWVKGDDNYPTLILEESAASGVNSLNIVESNY